MAVFGGPASPAPGATPTGSKRPSPSPDHLLMSAEAKKMRFQSSMRILKDEPVPDGYVRFRYESNPPQSPCGWNGSTRGSDPPPPPPFRAPSVLTDLCCVDCKSDCFLVSFSFRIRIPECGLQIQRRLSVRALRIQRAPDALPLHAHRLRLQFLRQDAIRPGSTIKPPSCFPFNSINYI